MIGQNLGGYRIVEQIGQGGMATVYKAYDAGTDRFVALKLLPETHSNNKQFRDRFQREAKAIARLEHAHILPIFAFGEDNNRTYLVMRYLSSGSLADYMMSGSLTDDAILRVLAQIASALDYAHQQNVIHRDVKPANVLLDANHNAFLTDFGIAKLVEATTQLTGQGLIGTPSYMSPEQCEGNKLSTGASDQYSLAVMLYEMITGTKLFTGDTPIAVILQHITAVLPDARALRPDLPDAAVQVIEIALSKSPTDRFATCTEFAAAFSDAMNGRAVTSLPPYPPPAATLARSPRDNANSSEPTRLAQPARKTPIWLFGVIGLIAIGVLIAAILLLRPKETDTANVINPPDGSTQSGDTPDVVVFAQPTATLSPIELAEFLTHCVELCIEGGGHSPIVLEIGDDLIVASNTLEFSWSPDGKQIVFSAEPEPTFKNIYIINRDGSDKRLLRAPADWPAWSPDGEWIAFNAGGRITAVRPDGTDERVLTEGVEGKQQWAAWSPDGRWIAWLNGEEWENQSAIWVKNVADGGAPYPIYSDAASRLNPAPPAWSPDGSAVVFRLASGSPRSVSATCDARTEQCPVTTLESFPNHWTQIYYPQWAGEAIPTHIAGITIAETVRTETFLSASDLPLILQGDGTFNVDQGWLSISNAASIDNAPGARTNFSLTVGNAWIVEFRLVKDSQYGFHFEWGSWPNNYAGLKVDGDLSAGVWSLTGSIAASGAVTWQMPALQADTWYYYVMQVQPDGSVYTAITPMDDPYNPVFVLEDNFGADWADRDFTLLMIAQKGQMDVAKITEVIPYP